MNGPVNYQKPVGEWTFDELFTMVTWQVMEGMVCGQSLRSSIYAGINLTLRWAAERPPVNP